MTTSTEDEDPPPRFPPRIRRRALAHDRPSRPLRQRLRLPLMLAGPIVVLLAACWWYLTSGRYVSTDDAYVQAARTMISADISGRVVAVAVHDNERVTKGQLLFQIDDRPYRIAVEEAKAKLAGARPAGRGAEGDLQSEAGRREGGRETRSTTSSANSSAAAPARGRHRVARDLRPGAERDAGGPPEGRLDAERRGQYAGPARRQSRPADRAAPVGAARPGGAGQGRARPVLHDGQGVRTRHRHQGRSATGRSIRQRLDPGVLDDLEAGLGRGELQGDRADAYAPRPDGDGRDRHLSGGRIQRPRSRA